MTFGVTVYLDSETEAGVTMSSLLPGLVHDFHVDVTSDFRQTLVRIAASGKTTDCTPVRAHFVTIHCFRNDLVHGDGFSVSNGLRKSGIWNTQ